MKLTKRSDSVSKDEKQLGISRRAFMRNTSLATAGGLAGASMFAPGMMRKAEAKTVDASKPVEVKRTICSHCSVGCGVYAEVQDGVWTGQEQHSTTHLTQVDIALKVLRCESTDTANVVSSIR